MPSPSDHERRPWPVTQSFNQMGLRAFSPAEGRVRLIADRNFDEDLGTEAIACALQVVVPTVAASARTLKATELDRLETEPPGPARQRWQRLAFAATVHLAGVVPRDSAPRLPASAERAVSTWRDHGPDALRRLLRPLKEDEAHRLALTLIVADVGIRHPAGGDAFDQWRTQVLERAR